MTKDECPRGEKCGVHYRVQEHDIRTDYIGLVDYVGEFAVATLMNDAALVQLAWMAGERNIEFSTRIYRVGSKACGDFTSEELRDIEFHSKDFDTSEELMRDMAFADPEEWEKRQADWVLSQHNEAVEMVASI